MEDIFPKFIIENDRLTIGKVSFHKDLVFEDKSKVKGGGWFLYIPEDKCFLLYGNSEDFGKADFNDIRKAVLKGWCDDKYSEGHYSDMSYRWSNHNKLEDALRENILIEKQ